MKENDSYILGTDEEELFRLGVQHQVWAKEARKGWELAGFRAGQTILDLGCGPGYCSTELGFIVGQSGKVIGIDKSAYFIDHLNKIADLNLLNIHAILSDFDEMQLDAKSLDGMYCRWGLAWHSDPVQVLKKVITALKSNGRMVIHEYYDWSTLQTEPRKESLSLAIAGALSSFKESPAEIDIGRKLPGLLSDLGLEIKSLRLMPKLATMHNGVWQWPKSFFKSYFPRLVKSNFLSEEIVTRALMEFDELEKIKGATICTPLMIEIIAEK